MHKHFTEIRTHRNLPVPSGTDFGRFYRTILCIAYARRPSSKYIFNEIRKPFLLIVRALFIAKKRYSEFPAYSQILR